MNEPGTLAHHVDYRRLATQRRDVSGAIALGRLPRVAAACARRPGKDEHLEADLRFFEDGQRRVRVEGSIRTTLTLICQRCLRDYVQSMDTPVAGVIVGGDEAAANVPRADEPVLADGDTLDLHALVSDELLLALPNVGRCDRADCRSRYAVEPETPAPEADDRQFPFAGLDRLTRDDD